MKIPGRFKTFHVVLYIKTYWWIAYCLSQVAAPSQSRERWYSCTYKWPILNYINGLPFTFILFTNDRRKMKCSSLYISITVIHLFSFFCESMFCFYGSCYSLQSFIDDGNQRCHYEYIICMLRHSDWPQTLISRIRSSHYWKLQS